eukprot:TRINITY_DN24787_c0_g1_i1.p1 TRINITY_DN24787_c0_g1~~TRINITY_DN24787_c0_g1_i1.p1  ORF type:complete len:121 (+),score=19.91 TRINITY_DN24787_c0_g1_i1:146-508(+)
MVLPIARYGIIFLRGRRGRGIKEFFCKTLIEYKNKCIPLVGRNSFSSKNGHGLAATMIFEIKSTNTEYNIPKLIGHGGPMTILSFLMLMPPTEKENAEKRDCLVTLEIGYQIKQKWRRHF